ncbi:FtsW/RodA/SpoVE family cell cycle protein [Lederbergia citrea]|uniref:FtsW/RodA/SpoVE family cell cycle protein n=1 Tax=Lederbergia citrea TaxID=2833581 RepID=UPI001BC986A7|nr:FtsW/RodA/SpoVE family cell cycle protein [Lederbergia citrea]
MKKGGHFFLNEVINQIHSKEARKYVADELGYHLKKAKSEWIGKGLTEEEAEEKSIEQMGSPILLGKQLNKLHRPKVDWLMVILLITALCLGFLPLFALGYMNGIHFAIYKVIFVLFGGAAALGMIFIDYRKLKKYGWMFFTIGMLILIMISLFSNIMINGLPYVRFGPMRIESSMALPFFFLAWASFFNNKKLKVWHFVTLFLLSFYSFLSIPTLSITFIYFIMVFVMLWWSEFSRKVIVTITALTVGSFCITGITLWRFLAIYQKERVLAFVNPEKYPNSGGFTMLQHKELLSKAGWFGSPMNNELISEAHTNFVFVSFTHYYGWLFAIALVCILSLFAARIIVVIPRINDSYGKLLLIGAVALYTIQLVYNIGMTLGFLPLTTMSLPFISYGLMPILLNAILIGLVLSVYRRKDLISSRVIFDEK